ncbi:hypothetical protein [Hyphococcus sp.]|uniref:hypothetical protein n=1 Tax=Hyphococcus sp. TaxID=2038636 RepID=UPI00208B2C9E|nr:MAG: hypothetical protein DHS20C04_29040 [Marinicaulis sp.]
MKVKLFAAAWTAMLLAMAAPAAAQDTQALQAASIDIYNTCLFAAGDYNEAGCACTAGFVGGAMSEREFDIAARLGRIGQLNMSGATQEAINAEVLAFLNAGYTQADADAVNAKMQSIAAKGDAICAPYEKQPST